MKKITALFFAVLMAFSCLAIMASAENVITTDTLVIDGVKDYSLKDGDVYTYEIEESGTYTFITTGSGNARITVTPPSTTLNPNPTSTIITPNKGKDIIKSVVITSSSSFLGKYLTKVSISSNDGKATKFKLYVLKDNKNSGLTKNPSNISKVYNEDKDFTYTDGKLVFKDGEPSFAGAEYVFRNTTGSADIYTLKDNDVKYLFTGPVYTPLLATLVYTATVGDVITYQVNPNYIKSAKITGVPAKDYVFGKDGKIKGSIGNYGFIPNVDLKGATVEVTYKYSSDTETLVVEKDSSGYYINCKYGGKTYITSAAKAQNKTYTYSAPYYVGNCATTISLSIVKASFFDTIKIFFGLLFGQYK